MSIFINCFRKMTQQSNKNELKGYKVTNVDRSRRFGVACRNLEELKRKACVKLNIPNEELDSVAVFLIDGSLIDDDYFLTLEPQTILIIQRPGEKILSDADIFYNILRQVNLEFLTTGDTVTKFLSKNLKSKISVLNKALNKDDTKTLLSSKDDHPEWFKNLDTTASTKEAYMHRRCQDRIRSYLYKTIDQIKGSDIYTKNELARRHLTHVISYFKFQLREDHCLGFYFDRSYAKDNKKSEICTSDVGSKDESDSVFNCPYNHCPCKIKIGNKSYSSEMILAKFFANDEFDADLSADELDARRIQYEKKTAIKIGKDIDDAREDDYCPYEIRLNDKDHSSAICDNKGEFHCDGVWNAERCAYGERHSINPYRSYEELVLFSTWNFDHSFVTICGKLYRQTVLISNVSNVRDFLPRIFDMHMIYDNLKIYKDLIPRSLIERSRTLIPNLLKASEQDTISQKYVRYFYDNIFTIKNLRLVHIICHDKGAHNHKQ